MLGLSGMASAYAMWMGQLSGLDGVDFSQNFYGTSLGYDRLEEQDNDNTWLFGLRGQITRA